jgi:hypothetical protein
VVAYGKALREMLRQEIAEVPQPLIGVDHFLRLAQDLAASSFPPALARGRQQAGVDSTFTVTDQRWLEDQLARNEQILRDNLGADLREFIEAQKLNLPMPTGDRAKAIDDRFGPRVENLYGGVLWKIQEAGYLSGIRTIRAIAHGTAPTIPVLRQAGADEEGFNEADWGGPVDMVNRAGNVPPQRQQRANALGRLVVTTSTDEQRASVLRMIAAATKHTVAQVGDFLARDEIAIGSMYSTQNDSRTCGPCADAAGEYYPPDEPPLPGAVCDGKGSCRCMLNLTVRVQPAAD